MRLLALQAVVGLIDAVAEDQAVLGELLVDRLDRVDDPLVVRGQEADQRDQEGRSVERVGVVVLAEDAAVGDAPFSRMSSRISSATFGPPFQAVLVPDAVREATAPVDGDPAHQLGGDVVLGLAAPLPDPLVGLLQTEIAAST